MGRRKIKKKEKINQESEEKVSTIEFDDLIKSDFDQKYAEEIDWGQQQTDVESLLDTLVEKVEAEGIEITKKEWEDLVKTWTPKEYGELYQMLNDILNSALKTNRYTMSQKRTELLGKMTRRTLLTFLPKIKAIHFLLIVLAICYIPPTILVAIDKIKEMRERRKKEYAPTSTVFEKTTTKERRERERKEREAERKRAEDRERKEKAKEGKQT